jgi:hypothetical protein
VRLLTLHLLRPRSLDRDGGALRRQVSPVHLNLLLRLPLLLLLLDVNLHLAVLGVVTPVVRRGRGGRR